MKQKDGTYKMNNLFQIHHSFALKGLHPTGSLISSIYRLPAHNRTALAPVLTGYKKPSVPKETEGKSFRGTTLVGAKRPLEAHNAGLRRAESRMAPGRVRRAATPPRTTRRLSGVARCA